MEKSADLIRIFLKQTSLKSNQKILLEIDRFCHDQSSVFNIFLTEVIICSFNNNTLQK